MADKDDAKAKGKDDDKAKGKDDEGADIIASIYTDK